MWGVTSFGDELTGDFCDGFEAISIGDFGLFYCLAGKIVSRILGLLQQYRPISAALVDRLRVGYRRSFCRATGDEICRACRDEAAERREIGPKIRKDRNTQTKEAASLIERELGACAVIAALIIRDESLGAVLLPLHRPLKLAACPNDECLFGLDEGLHTERATDIGCD